MGTSQLLHTRLWLLCLMIMAGRQSGNRFQRSQASSVADILDQTPKHQRSDGHSHAFGTEQLRSNKLVDAMLSDMTSFQSCSKIDTLNDRLPHRDDERFDLQASKPQAEDAAQFFGSQDIVVMAIECAMLLCCSPTTM